MKSNQTRHLYEFGLFRLDPSERLLLRDGEPVPLTPKAFETLVVLVERSGHLVEKDDLMKEVWPDSFVEEVGLARNISALRKALGEGVNEHRYIETVPKRGYRFVARVTELNDEHADLVLERHISAHVIAEEEETFLEEEPERTELSEELTVARKSAIAATANEKDLAGYPASSVKRLAGSVKHDTRLGRMALALLAATVVVVAYYYFTGSKKIDSIAILPFVNAGTDPNTEYLSDGITENTINSLSQLAHLRVVPRTTAFHYKGRQVDPQQVGRELGVGAVLTGRVVKQNDSFSIQTELIDISNGSQIWGQQYHWRLPDIIAGQEEIATSISEKLRLRLTGEEQKRLTRRYTENPDAYQLYLRGRYFWNKRTEEGLSKGISYFEQAIDLDPGYALAYAGLADSYLMLYDYDLRPSQDSVPRARAAALRALELDETLAEAHVSLAYLKWVHDWDWSGAEQEYQRALELHPASAPAHHWYGLYLASLGRFDESLAEMRRAQELDPLSLAINSNTGRVLYFARQYDRAIAEFQKTLEMDPNFIGAHYKLAAAYGARGMQEEAVIEYQKWKALDGENDVAEALGRAYAVSGYRGAMQKWLDILKERAAQHYVSPYGIGLLSANVGDKEQALKWLEKALDNRSPWIIYLKVEPQLDGLRTDPRFTDLVRRLGAPH